MKKRNKLRQTILKSIRLAALTGVISMFSATAFAAVDNHALPTGGQFVAGAGSILAANGVMTVNQNDAAAAIKWNTFNVGANATVNFNHNGSQNGNYAILNYSANAGKASEIYGRLKAGAGADVWLVNPNGVIIGKGAQIDVGHMHLAARDLEGKSFASIASNDNIKTLVNGASMGNGELMSMGNLYVNSINFDGNRVVIDADKLYKYDGTKVELGEKGKLNNNGNVVDASGNELAHVILDVDGNTTGGYLSIGTAATDEKPASHAKEVVVGYTVFDENGTGAKGIGTYENSANWRAIYTTLAGKTAAERVGFAWVEDSTQLERIGEGEKTLSRDFALKDGIAAINTKEMDGGAGFTPIGKDPNVEGQHAFTGKFDGLGYDIYGLTINRPDENDIGMFGHVGDGAVIRNVNLVSGSIVGNNKVGGVVGHAKGQNITIENAKNSARILGIDSVGGIVGKAEGNGANGINIINAENVALVRGNTNVGGIVGNMYHTNVVGETYNTGAVKGIVNYKTADTSYASKTAAQLTEATYSTKPVVFTNSGVPVAGDTFVFTTHGSSGLSEVIEIIVESINGTVINGEMSVGSRVTGKYVPHGYVTDQAGKTVYVERTSESKYSITWPEKSASWGNKDKDLITHTKVSTSSNVGGIAGYSKDSTIGHSSTGFKIYNDTEIEAGYNVGGIVGSFNTGTVQNVENKGKIEAFGYTHNEYHFWSSNANDMPGGTSAVNVTNNGKKNVRVANAGGIVGLAIGATKNNATFDPTTLIKDSLNSGDVITDTQHENDYDYHVSGNVGGIVGYAATIDDNGAVIRDNSQVNGYGVLIENVENKENIIRGAHNVGGIVGDLLNAKVLDATNNGGDVAASGARAQNGGFSFEAVRSNASANQYLTGNIGGIVGYMEGQQSYVDSARNRGTIHTFDVVDEVATDITKAANVGGIVGKVSYRNQYKSLAFKEDGTGFDNTKMSQGDASAPIDVANIEGAAVRNSANTGDVRGYTDIGGIVGQMYTGEIEKSYNLGNVTSSFASVASNAQANLGGILGDVTAQSTGFVRIYDVYNAGTIGDSTFSTYGIHVGGIAGRFLGEMDKVYNVGNIYVGASVNGGLIGYAQANLTNYSGNSGDTNSFNNVKISNAYNAGNILNYINNGAETRVGGLIGVTESVQSTNGSGGAGKIVIENAYNIGSIRSINNSNKAGGLVGHITSGGLNIKNAYSTGEIYTGKLNGTIHPGTVNAIAPGGTVYENVYFIRPKDASKFTTPAIAAGVKTIDYDNRYDINQWVNGSNRLVGTHYTTTNSLAEGIFSGNFRMYLYDERTGETLHYDSASKKYKTATNVDVDNQYVKATLPTLNTFVPNISKYLGGSNGVVPENLAYVQYGNEYDPLMTFANVSDGKTLIVDYTKANIVGRGGLVVENGGLTINNVNSSDYFSGTFMAKNGDLTINATQGTLNLASDSRFYGKNVTINNPTQDINNNGVVESYNGNITINGKNVEVFGAITASSKFNDADGKPKSKTVFEGVRKSSYGNDGDYTNLSDYTKDVSAVSDKFKEEISTETNGKISITAAENVGLYLGNNRIGKISTDNDLTITGQNIYSDIDMKVGVNSGTNLTMKADSIIFDISNMGITAPIASSSDDEKRKITINNMLDYFKSGNENGNALQFESLSGGATEAKLVLNYFNDDNSLNIHKYDDGTSNTISKKVAALNYAEGSEKPALYTWVSNAAQLNNIQKAFTDANDTNKAQILATNFALKNDIDASEVETYKSIGLIVTGEDAYKYNAYQGIFDGMGHNLNSLSPHDTVGNTGLFGVIGEEGVVKNLNINASRLTGNSTRVGLVAGTNMGRIENVQTFGNTIKDSDHHADSPKFVGGIVGLNDENGVINGNTKSEDVVYSDSANTQVDVGGIAGLNEGIIHNATGKSDVSVAEGGATSLGGVVGVNVGLLKDVTSLGVTAGLYKKQAVGHTDEVIGAGNVGGVAGENRTTYVTADHKEGATTKDYTYYIKDNGDGTYEYSRNKAITGASEFAGGTISDAYNDSKVKGWSNTGGVVGRNFGVGDTLQISGIENDAAGKIYYVANAADVEGGENVGGLVGTNNGQVGIGISGVVVTDAAGDTFTFSATGALSSSIFVNTEMSEDAKEAAKDEAKAFYSKYIKGNDEEISQIIYGRNSGKITGEYGLKQGDDTSTGSNVGGLMGVSGVKANVENLVNGKAASVYGAVNVGGLIGENQGVLQKSTNMMQNNEIAGAWHVGGIIGKNTGVVVGMENTNKYNITTNTAYVNENNGALNEAGINAVNAVVYPDASDANRLVYSENPVEGYKGYASYFGGVVGNNAANGVVGDVINYANVTIDRPAHYVGGIIGRNDGQIAYAGMEVQNPDTTATSTNLDLDVQGYLRNNGEVGVMHNDSTILAGGKYIGGVIGENNANIYMTDITNNIGGSVTGDSFVGGIIGRNTATVSGGRNNETYGTDGNNGSEVSGNYYKYDIYNNGKVTGTAYVGGLIGSNDTNNANLKLAYNTGVVHGSQYVGGIVGSNAGNVDQVFNSTGAYDKNGEFIDNANRGVTGTNYVGGLVGKNTGSLTNSYNTGVVSINTTDGNVGKASKATDGIAGNAVGLNLGSIEHVYATNENGALYGSNTDGNVAGTITKSVSLSSTDASKEGITVLSGNDKFTAQHFVALNFDTAKWTFQDGVSTPLLKNFLTKAYFVGDASSVYNGLNQIVQVDKPVAYAYTDNLGGVHNYYRAAVYVVNADENGSPLTGENAKKTYVGFVYAADETGDHSIEDFYKTYGLIANDQADLIKGNNNTASSDHVTHVKRDTEGNIIGYTLLSSSQINTNYVKRDATNNPVMDANGLYDVNPNMLGFEFVKATLPVTIDSESGKPVTDPQDTKTPLPEPIPNTDPTKPVVTDQPPVTPNTTTTTTNDPYNPTDPSSQPAPELRITARKLSISVNDVIMSYGATENNGSSTVGYYGYKEQPDNIDVYYTYQGKKIADSGVDNLYGLTIGGDGLAAGDTYQKVVNYDLSTITKAGFVNDGFESNTKTKSVTYDSSGKPIANNTLTLKSEIQSAINTNYNSDYEVTTDFTGDVTITPAVLGYNGNVVYRTYGDITMYEKDAQGNKVNIGTTDYKYDKGSLHGVTNGDELSVITNPSNLTVTAQSGSISDGGKNPQDPTKTNNVGSYQWGDGSITIVDSQKYQSMNNYRIYDFGNTDVDQNPFGLSGAIGGTSIVEPAKLTITVQNTTAGYGSDYEHRTPESFTYVVDKANTSTASTTVTGNTLTGATVNGDKLENIFASLTYDNQGYVGTNNGDLTKDVVAGGYDINLNSTLKTGTDSKAGNYEIVINKGNINITPKEVTLKDLLAENVYGSAFDASQPNITNYGTLNGIIESDNGKVSVNTTNIALTLKPDDDNNNYLDALGKRQDAADVSVRDKVVTPDVAIYNNSLNVTGVTLTGEKAGNYVLVDTNTGSLKVVPYEVVINVANGGNVVYGTLGDLKTADPYGADVTVDSVKKPVNGDSLSEVVTYTINNGAFNSERQVGTQYGTKDVGTYGMTVDVAETNLKTGATKIDGVISGDSDSGNYKVTIIDNNVDVTARPVVVIPPGEDIPSKDDPKFDPNVIYVKANDVVRIYGNTAKDKPYNVIITGAPSWDYDSENPTSATNKLTWNAVADNGLRDGQLAAAATNNAGNHVWDAMVYLDPSVSGNYSFATTNIVKGNSKVNRAELEIILSDHENIVYGVDESLLKGRYTGTVNGLVKQDIDDGRGVNASDPALNILSYTHNNTGYINGVGQNVSDANGKQINYAHNTGSTTIQNGIYEKGVLSGISEDGNYNVKIVDGVVNFVNRKVTPYDPTNPTYPNVPNPNYNPDKPNGPDNPKVVPGIPDPSNPGSYIPYNPANSEPSLLPENDPKYQPDNPDDPRNQVFVIGNIVERNEGNPSIIGSYNRNETPDGKKNYGVATILGLPKWIDPNGVGVKVPNPGLQDGGMLDNNTTNRAGRYTWFGTLDIPGFGNNFDIPKQSVPGISIVNRMEVGEVIPPKYVEDLYPWLHNTNHDHGWGHQDHWRERKAEVKYTVGGADFFNDLVIEKDENGDLIVK